MGIVVNTNVSSILVQRSLGSATKEISNSLEKLSTGFKINRAADDAAGLVISESLRSQARGAAQASSNAQTGVNLLQTAEADLGIVQENLQRVRDLTVQAANGTYGTTERTAIYSEVSARTQEIDRIAKSSAFNTIKLLDGSNTGLVLQIGSNSTVSLNSLTIGSPLGKATSSTLGLGSTTDVSAAFNTASAASSFLSKIDTAISTVSTRRSEIGSLQNRLDSAIKSLAIKQENMLAADSRIRDTDVSKEAANLTKNQILQQASASLLAQANQSPQIALSLLK
jgi:flagellin